MLNLLSFSSFVTTDLGPIILASASKNFHLYPGALIFALLFSATFAIIYSYEYYFIHHDEPIYTRERIVQAEIDPDVLNANKSDRNIQKASAVFLGILIFVTFFVFLFIGAAVFFALIL